MSRRHSRGMTLVELMVAMVLGLVIVGGVIGVMLANKRSYSTNQGLSEVQETARTAFELMARDIRQAAGNGCDTPTRTSNLLGSTTEWWQTWWGMKGVNNGAVDPAVSIGTAVGERVVGTDTIHVQGLDSVAFAVESADASANTITLDSAAPFETGDIILACDFDHAAIFQITDWDAATNTLTHDVGGGTPGNCSSGLGFPAVCDGAAGTSYEFPENSQVSRLLASVWYIGNNGRAEDGGRSLYRRRLGAGGVVVTEEIVSGVTDLQVRYGQNGSNDIQDAAAVASWDAVNSIFITLTADSISSNVTTNPAENQGRISRTFTYLITLRNRVS